MPTLSLAFHRADGGSPSAILAFVTASDTAGAPVSGLSVVVDGRGVTTAATEDAGFYLATIVPPFTSGELSLFAHLVGGDGGAVRTALVLPGVSAAWDQPEPVAGLVNTPGTEDSSTVSPDGQWLIVGTYSPIDVMCCSAGCGGYPPLGANNPACNLTPGPIAAPARPGMPGADRVLSSTLIDLADPDMCAAEPDGGPVQIAGDAGPYPFALFPVADYGFHRQADGSYAEPFLITTGSDGFPDEPYCLTFLGNPKADGTVPVIFGYNVYSATDKVSHPWVTTLTLGQTNALGSYTCNATLPGYPTFTPNGITAVPVGPVGQRAGNTSLAAVDSGFYLLSDDESADPPYVEYSLWDGGAGYSDWAVAALPEPGVDRRQPVAAGGRLFYYRNRDIASVAWNGGSPGDGGSFADLATVLASEASPSGRVGEVIAVGQPTFADVDGGVEMFFVYYQRSASGFDGQIGRVPLR
jgi:hypothetical protein